MNRTELLKESLLKYNSYGDNWLCDYFNHDNGGYLAVDKQRIEHSKISKNEKEKFDKEYAMSMAFARNGYKIEMLRERSGFSSSDITINGVMAELKKTSSHNNILNYAKKAIEKQGAKMILFEFEKETVYIKEKLKKLKIKGISIKYYFSNNPNEIMFL
jgi:hypothetical protein